VGMMIAQLGKGPSVPLPSITLQSLAELDTLREMIECEDEQVLNDYLHSITGGGAQSRQDLIDFLNLVDNTPYAKFIDGEITGLTYNQTDKRFSVSTEAENGESMYVSYELGMSDVEKNMEKAAGKLGRKNLLSAPLSTEDGRLTLYTETREPSSNGDVIRWQGVLDGIAVYIVYWVADADAIDTAALLDRLKIADSIVPQFPGYAWANTKFGPFVQDPEFKNYSVVQESGAYGSMGWGHGSNYYDPNAPATYKAPYPISECTDTLQYRDSVTHSLDAQAVHNYVFESERAYYDVIVDAETGECIGWQLEGELLGVPYVTEQEKIDAVYAYLAGCVSDPEAYTLGEREVLEGYTVYRYSRYVGEFDSCDALIAYFDSQGNMVAILGSYLGAMREMEEIPQDLLDTVRAKLTEIANTYADAFEISISIKKLYISPVGQIALNCSVTVREQELGERLEYRYHVYLTEWVISAD
ncbi:MAG: hypothetical protein IIX86_08080, partial [Clostridia bacterium]|nr:hypothetical protein [Clostridia bacterium]